MNQRRDTTREMVGRQQDLRLVEISLASACLVTLVGPGGVGKTALASAAAEEADTEFARVVVVELVGAELIGEVACLISSALIGEPIEDLDRIAGALDVCPTLLVVDNCEQALDAVGIVVPSLLAKSGTTTILATSRHPLDLQDEVTLSVQPLPFPTELSDAIADYSAVRLFVQRAKQANPSFKLTAQNGGLVASICARADGVPLVIELAAALVRTQSLNDIFTSMVHPAGSLEARRRDLYDHQRSVVASLEWSRRFLTANEISLLGAVSIFTGGFTSAAARFVGTVDDDSALVGLVDHSMVQFDQSSGRYRVLEPIRADSEDRLTSQEADALIEKHLLWCEALAQEIGDAMYEADPDRRFPAYDYELTNLGSGLRRCWQAGERERFCRILAPMANWWVHKARPEGVEEWSGLLADEARTPAQIVSIALALSYYWGHQGQHQRSIDYAVLARGNAQSVGDTTNECATLMAEGHALAALGRQEEGIHRLRDCLDIAERTNAASPLLWAKVSLARLDEENASDYLSGALELAEQGFTVFEALVLVELARLSYAEGRLSEARVLVNKGLAIAKEVDFGEGIGTALCARADVAAALGDLATARADFTSALEVALRIGHEGVRAAAQDGMDALPRTTAPTVAAVDAEPLTDRELSVAFLLRGDLTQREIADELYIAPSTVKTHTKSIYRKLGVSKRSHAITRAMELGLFKR